MNNIQLKNGLLLDNMVVQFVPLLDSVFESSILTAGLGLLLLATVLMILFSLFRSKIMPKMARSAGEKLDRSGDPREPIDTTLDEAEVDESEISNMNKNDDS